MNLISLSKLPLSADEGWPELAQHRPGIFRILCFLVLPLSFVATGNALSCRNTSSRGLPAGRA